MKTCFCLITLFTFSIINTYGQKKVKEGITMQQLKTNNYVMVSFDEIKYSRFDPVTYQSFAIETGDELYTSLVDSLKNAIPLSTPIKTINYFDQQGWELAFYETSFTPDKPATDDKYQIYQARNRIVFIFRQKKTIHQ